MGPPILLVSLYCSIIIPLPDIFAKVIIHHVLVETLVPSFSIRTPSHQLAPGNTTAIAQGTEFNQEDFIKEIYDNGMASHG